MELWLLHRVKSQEKTTIPFQDTIEKERSWKCALYNHTARADMILESLGLAFLDFNLKSTSEIFLTRSATHSIQRDDTQQSDGHVTCTDETR